MKFTTPSIPDLAIATVLEAMALCLLILGCFDVSADEIKSGRNQYQLSHQTTSAVIDGVIDEAVWQNATQIELAFENNPGDGIKAPVKTIGYVYEDGDSLYLAIEAFDPQPANIRAHLSDRDKIWSDDFVGLVIDTFNDERQGYEFYVNPMGAQADMRMSDINGWRKDTSWDAIWHSGAKITSTGWSAEMRIPFSALRFDATNGKKVWNFTLWRNYPRDVQHELASYQSNRDLKCSLCQFDQLAGFEKIEAGQNIQITPTITMGRNDNKNDAGQWQSGDTDQDAGLDLRWGITQDSVLNVTINPDFSQVEADVTQLNVNSTYSLFLREKRAFFLDGADYFDSGHFNLVHTRNIADPDYGVKLTGKSGQHSYGLLVANDNQTAFLLPGNQGSRLYNYTDAQNSPLDSKIAIARYKADLGGRNTVGVLATTRQADGYDNTLASLDGSYWLNEENSVQYQLAYSDSTNPDALVNDYGLAQTQQDHAYSFNYYHNNRDYQLSVNYADVGKDFRADLGFMGQVDHKALNLSGKRTYYGEQEDVLNQYGYFADFSLDYDQDGNQLNRTTVVKGYLNGPMQSYAQGGFVNERQFYQSEFNPLGEYFEQSQLQGFSRITPVAGLTLLLSFRHGDALDWSNARLATEFNVWGTVEWQFGKHISGRLDYEHETLKSDGYDVVHAGQTQSFDSGTLYTANRTNLRLAYQFDIRSQLKLTVQYSDISRNTDLYRGNFDDNEYNNVGKLSRSIATQLLYSYKLNPQTLVYLGYSDGGFQSGEMDKLSRDQRSVFAKFSYAWQG